MTERVPEEPEGVSFEERLKRGALAEKLIIELLEKRGWTVSKKGLGAGSEQIFSYDEAKSNRNRFEPDYRLSKDSIYGKLEVDAEFKGTWKGALWINKYQFETMHPDVLIIAVDFRTRTIYCALKGNLERVPHKEILRPGYSGAESRAVLVFEFKDMNLAENCL